MHNESQHNNHEINEDIAYESPAIVYEGKISTRAGSPITSGYPVPPAEREVINLFPED